MYEIYDESDSPEMEYPPPSKPPIGSVSQQSGSVGSYSSTCSDPSKLSVSDFFGKPDWNILLILIPSTHQSLYWTKALKY